MERSPEAEADGLRIGQALPEQKSPLGIVSMGDVYASDI
jgi:hypothetical protein